MRSSAILSFALIIKECKLRSHPRLHSFIQRCRHFPISLTMRKAVINGFQQMAMDGLCELVVCSAPKRVNCPIGDSDGHSMHELKGAGVVHRLKHLG